MVSTTLKPASKPAGALVPRRFVSLALAAAVAVLLGCATPALTQPPGKPGPETIRATGVLNAQGQRLMDGRYFDVFAVPVEPGFHYEFLLRSKDFDAFMWIQPVKLGPDNTVPGEQLRIDRAWKVDDDSGGGTDARITGTFAKPAMVGIVVTTFEPGQQGRFELLITRTPLAKSGGKRPVEKTAGGGGSLEEMTVAQLEKHLKEREEALERCQLGLQASRETLRHLDPNTALAAYHRGMIQGFSQQIPAIEREIQQIKMVLQRKRAAGE
jgi:hypothetical protein